MPTAKDVRAALYGGELFLEYQPVVTLLDARCVGGEALIRWRRGARVVSPKEFIPLIEDTPVSGLLTYWVIDTVAQELGAWLRTHGAAHLAINVPPEVFGRGGLEYAAAKSGVLGLANQFVVEVTERGVPDRLGIRELNSMPRRGVLVALDDVCTSESSILIALEARVDILKLEKSCVDSITRDDFSVKEVSALSSLIRSADISIVAEGVETSAQVGKLREAGIGMAQGWLFSRPLPAADFMKYFAAHG